MPSLSLHHVSISVSNLAKSVEFYTTVIGMYPIKRPPFKSDGAWLACGDQQVHLNPKPLSNFDLARKFNPTEPHFALRTDDLAEMIKRLAQQGYNENQADDDPKRLITDLNGLAGFPQIFVFDPDRNLVEINAIGTSA
jgi:catechol 2,3-dioxygenase-like lactoylglutathione lyase family enzyme